MAQWNIRLIAVRREPFDKNMYVQALLAFGRQLFEAEQAAKIEAGDAETNAAPEASV